MSLSPCSRLGWVGLGCLCNRQLRRSQMGAPQTEEGEAMVVSLECKAAGKSRTNRLLPANRLPCALALQLQLQLQLKLQLKLWLELRGWLPLAIHLGPDWKSACLSKRDKFSMSASDVLIMQLCERAIASARPLSIRVWKAAASCHPILVWGPPLRLHVRCCFGGGGSSAIMGAEKQRGRRKRSMSD